MISPIMAPIAIERMAISVFSPFNAPEMPISSTQSASPFMITSWKRSGRPFFKSKPSKVPRRIAAVLTIVPSMESSASEIRLFDGIVGQEAVCLI